MMKYFLFFISFVSISLVAFLGFLYFNQVPRTQLPYQETYQLKGKIMSYFVLGEGDPLIMIHGSMVHDLFEADKELSKDFKVYVLDLPGFGASDVVAGVRHDTDLFAEAVCEFVKVTGNENTPVVAASLGSVVAAKAADKGCLNGKLILIGAPVKLFGWQSNFVSRLPLSLRKLIVSSYWGKDKILTPLINTNIGGEGNDDNSAFIKELTETDAKSLGEVDYKKSMEEDFPRILPSLKNEIIFIYGEHDVQKGASSLIENYITIEDVDHNVFKDDLKKSVEVIKKELGGGL